MKKKIVLHSLLVNEPDLERKLFNESELDADLVFVPNEEIEGFYEEIRDADGVIIADRKINPKHVETLKNCKIIARQGIGYDNIELTKTKEKGIVVTNVPDYCLPEVSDFAISLMMTLLRHIPTYDKHVREGIWDISSILTESGYPEMRRLSSQTIGIFGFGKIAQEVAKKVKAFGFEILVVDPYMKEDYVKKFGAKLVSLEELLKESDVITIHSPLTPETKYIFNKEAFEKMKNNAILINTARGPLVNESDLHYALKNKIIAGAALDVTENEPLENDSPLRELENIIITPHAAFFTKDSYYELRERAAKEVLRVLSGEKAESKVN